MEQLLATKLYIPPSRKALVSRFRLIDRMEDGLRTGRKLTLISAPAGFGKTTLVCEWIDHLRLEAEGERESAIRIAWLSLDEGDNDRVRFLAYLITALSQIKGMEASLGESALAVIQSPQPPPTAAVLTSLINEVSAFPERILLVLDDYHSIESTQVDDALCFLLEHLPPQLHLVIATRMDPHLPVARLRVRGELSELRAADLRFTLVEAAEFLNRTMGLDLSPEDIAALETRTEGWVAGLQLAAISMHGGKKASGFIQSFTGSHRFILDYLVEEVLDQQPEHIQTFLYKTSVLKRLSGPLCDALTGQTNGQETLEWLEHANLFLIPLDNERRWYRYHHLFAELLQRRVNVIHPHWLPDLHAKAVIWHEANGNLSEAIQHAFASGDIQTATHLTEKGALFALERSDFAFIFNFVDRLPDTALKRSPWLYIYHSWALILTGQVEATSLRLKNTDWLLNFVSEDEIQKRKMLGFIAGLKTQLAAWQRDYGNMLDFANQAIENLPKNHWICGYCAMMKGVASWGNGNLIAAKDAFAEAALVGQATGNKRVAVTSAGYLCHSLELEGHLQQAVELLQNSFQFADQEGKKFPLAGYLHIDLARLLYELNEVDLANQHLKEGIKLCQQLSDGRVEKIGYCLLARVYLAKGDLTGVVHSIQDAEQAHSGTELTVDMRGGEYPQIRLWLKQNELGEIEAWLQESELNIENIPHFKTKLAYTMHARAMIALSRAHPEGAYLRDAQDLLAALLELAESHGWGSKVIEILALQAMAFQEQGDIPQALNNLERALQLAEPEGFMRTFVDEGPPMARLLHEALSRRMAPNYVRRLLAVLSPEPTRADRSILRPSKVEMIEPLSEREIEVLQLIAEGLTNPEIAAKLYLSLNTVKVHTRNIFGKLDVHRRAQAIARSQALGLLPGGRV